MKKIFLFWSVFLIFSFGSCKFLNLLDVKSDSSEDVVTFSGSLVQEIGKSAEAVPSGLLKNVSEGSKDIRGDDLKPSSRQAFPEATSSTLYYSVSCTNGTRTFTGDADSSGAFTVSVPLGDSTITAKAFLDSKNTQQIYEGTLSLSGITASSQLSGNTITLHDIQTGTEATSTVSLPIKIDANISKVTATISNGSSGAGTSNTVYLNSVTSGKTYYFTLASFEETQVNTANTVPGIYDVEFSFFSTVNSTDEYLAFYTTQKIIASNYLSTTEWNGNGADSCINAMDGNFEVTDEVCKSFLSTTVYVDSSVTSDSSASGSFSSPFKSMQKAVDVLQSRQQGKPCSLYLKGNITATAQDFTNGSLINIENSANLSIKIKSYPASENFTIDAANLGRILFVGSGNTITLGNVVLQNGTASDSNANGGTNGGAVYNNGTLNLGKCTVLSSSASGFGNAIYSTSSSQINFTSAETSFVDTPETSDDTSTSTLDSRQNVYLEYDSGSGKFASVTISTSLSNQVDLSLGIQNASNLPDYTNAIGKRIVTFQNSAASSSDKIMVYNAKGTANSKVPSLRDPSLKIDASGNLAGTIPDIIISFEPNLTQIVNSSCVGEPSTLQIYSNLPVAEDCFVWESSTNNSTWQKISYHNKVYNATHFEFNSGTTYYKCTLSNGFGKTMESSTFQIICDSSYDNIGKIFYSDGTYSSDLDSSKTALGIVYDVDTAGTKDADGHYKPKRIVYYQDFGSVMNWSMATSISDYRSFSETDGSVNLAALQKSFSGASTLSDYPPFEYAESLTLGGLKWFIPSRDELKQIANNGKAINAGLDKISGSVKLGSSKTLDKDNKEQGIYYYWSSTPRNVERAWAVRMNVGPNEGWFSGPFFKISGTTRITARAVADVSVPTPSVPTGFVKINGGAVTTPIGAGPFKSASTADPVKVDAFYIAETEVTYQRWKEVYDWATTGAGMSKGYVFANVGREGSSGTDGASVVNGQQPVTNISWRDAVVWCNAASEMESLTPVYMDSESPGQPVRRAENGTDSIKGTNLSNTFSAEAGKGKAEMATIDLSANGYRLPKDAEWEFAARGGDPDSSDWNYQYAGTDNASELGTYAVYAGNSGDTTANVRSKTANKVGLFDMSGNVWEWCYDANTDPSYSLNGRIDRGASYSESTNSMSFDSATDVTLPYKTYEFFGFRLARNDSGSGGNNPSTPITRTAPAISSADKYALSGKYSIASEAELKTVSEWSTDGTSFSGVTLVLDSDIKLSSDAANPFEPIGSSTQFRGTFDGQGHKITNLYVETSGNAGLFADINPSSYTTVVVKNLTVEGTIISSSTFIDNGVGGIVGKADAGIIENCVSNVTITSATQNTGGICGYVSTSGGAIRNCINVGKITSTSINVGGIVGNAKSDVYNCANFGAITGSSNVAGIVGTTSSAVALCYNVGQIVCSVSSSSAAIANVTGSPTSTTSYEHCFYKTSSAGGAFTGVNPGNIRTFNNSPTEINLDTELKNAIGTSSFKEYCNPWGKKFTFGSIEYPVCVEVNVSADESGTGGGGNPSNPLHTNYTPNGTDVIALDSSVTSFKSGVTYTISDKAGLSTLATLVSSGNTGSGSKFVLTGNVNLESTSPNIGTSTNPFAGTLEGNNYCIYGLNATAKDNSVFSHIGNGATVKNLRVKGSVTAAQNIGGFASNSYGDVTIENCISDVDFSNRTSRRYAGGFIGYAQKTGTVKIINSVNNGSFTTSRSGDAYVSGFVGYAGRELNFIIRNCVNNGDINSTASSASYISGFINASSSSDDKIELKYCVNNGTITTSATVPTLVGAFGGGSYGTISYSKYLLSEVVSGTNITAKGSGTDSASTGLTEVSPFADSEKVSVASKMNEFNTNDADYTYVNWITNSNSYADLDLHIEDVN